MPSAEHAFAGNTRFRGERYAFQLVQLSWKPPHHRRCEGKWLPVIFLPQPGIRRLAPARSRTERCCARSVQGRDAVSRRSAPPYREAERPPGLGTARGIRPRLFAESLHRWWGRLGIWSGDVSPSGSFQRGADRPSAYWCGWSSRAAITRRRLGGVADVTGRQICCQEGLPPGARHETPQSSPEHSLQRRRKRLSHRRFRRPFFFG